MVKVYLLGQIAPHILFDLDVVSKKKKPVGLVWLPGVHCTQWELGLMVWLVKLSGLVLKLGRKI